MCVCVCVLKKNPHTSIFGGLYLLLTVDMFFYECYVKILHLCSQFIFLKCPSNSIGGSVSHDKTLFIRVT